MKIAIICDTHFGVRNDSPIFNDYMIKSLGFFFDTLTQRKIKTVIHLGDLFDRRKYLNFNSANVCRRYFIEELDRRKIHTHIIAGNHDHYHKNDYRINSLDEIVSNRYDHIKTYIEPQDISLGGTNILLVPWIDDSKPPHFYQAIANSKSDVLMGHLAINGFRIDSGNISSGADERNTFEKFDLVFSGHYHHKSSQDNIHYLGAFAEQTWSDWNDPRGISIFDAKTRALEFIENPHKMFHILAYDDSLPNIEEIIQITDYSIYTDSYVKVLCNNKKNQYMFDQMLEKLYASNPADISVIENSLVLNEQEQETLVNQSESTQVILDKYISSLTLPVDDTVMKAFMRDIYNEAISMEHVG